MNAHPFDCREIAPFLVAQQEIPPSPPRPEDIRRFPPQRELYAALLALIETRAATQPAGEECPLQLEPHSEIFAKTSAITSEA